METLTTNSTGSIYLSGNFRTFSESHSSLDHSKKYDYQVLNNDMPVMSKPLAGASNCISGFLTASIVDSSFDQHFLRCVE